MNDILILKISLGTNKKFKLIAKKKERERERERMFKITSWPLKCSTKNLIILWPFEFSVPLNCFQLQMQVRRNWCAHTQTEEQVDRKLDACAVTNAQGPSKSCRKSSTSHLHTHAIPSPGLKGNVNFFFFFRDLSIDGRN